MSLETVAEDIRDEARERAAEIRAEAEERADDIRAEAEADADEIASAAEREVEREIDREREQQLSSAKLEAKQMRLEARRDVLADVRDSVEERLASLPDDEREELTRDLLDEATEEFDADSMRVYARAADAELVQEILEDYDGYEYAGERDCLGGVIVESDESRVRVDNTFDSVLEDVWENNLKDVSARLFDGEQ